MNARLLRRLSSNAPAALPEYTREQALSQLSADFPDVAVRILDSIYLTYEACLGSTVAALEATRARVADACAA